MNLKVRVRARVRARVNVRVGVKPNPFQNSLTKEAKTNTRQEQTKATHE